MNFRQADIHDILPVTLLWTKMIQEIFDEFIILDKVEVDNFSFALCDRLRYPNTYTLLAESEGRIIGFIHGYVQERPYGKPREVAFCECLYIEPEYRGKGIDKELITGMETWAKEQKLILEFMTKYNTDLDKIWSRKSYKPYAIIYRGGISWDF